jgi:hypothetical protein
MLFAASGRIMERRTVVELQGWRSVLHEAIRDEPIPFAPEETQS